MSTHYVPAMKAKMGDWIYYITKMKFGDVENQVKLAEQIHPNRQLDELIQRDLSDRVQAMTRFLLKEKQRFYGSLVVAVYKGNPVFKPVVVSENHHIVDEVDHSFGLLQFDGSQTFFALDGQHRLESIKAACAADPDLRGEEISVIVLHHEGSPEGMVRTRRLFTKLNRYAKPTDNRTNIAIDEDDCVAILTRQFVREYKKMDGLVKIDATSKQIGTGKADASFLTTMFALYEFNLELMQAYDKNLPIDRDFRAQRPEDDVLDGMHSYLIGVWDALIDGVPVLKKIAQGQAQPGALRGGDNGGCIWVRPNVQLIVAEVIKNALLDGTSLDKVVMALARLPDVLGEEPWVKILWNPDTKKIIGTAQDRKFLVDLIMHATGVAKPSRGVGEMKEAYGAIHGKKSKALPDYRLPGDAPSLAEAELAE